MTSEIYSRTIIEELANALSDAQDLLKQIVNENHEPVNLKLRWLQSDYFNAPNEQEKTRLLQIRDELQAEWKACDLEITHEKYVQLGQAIGLLTQAFHNLNPVSDPSDEDGAFLIK